MGGVNVGNNVKLLLYIASGTVALFLLVWVLSKLRPLRDFIIRKYGTRYVFSETYKALGFLLPSLVIIVIFIFIPFVYSFVLSFYYWDMISATKLFVGLENYLDLLRDPDFWLALKNTVIYVLAVVPANIVLGLFFAVLLNQDIRFRGAFRSAFFLPWVTPISALALVWRWIYDYDYGLLNWFLQLAGIEPINWLEDPRFALLAVIIMSIWHSLGYSIVIFLAGLQSIDKSLYEAAEIDGASSWDMFWKITWPLISPTTFFLTIVLTIGAFKVFQEVYMLFSGTAGPDRSAMTLMVYFFTKAFDDWRMGYASAIAYTLFFIVFILTMIQRKFLEKHVHYGG